MSVVPIQLVPIFLKKATINTNFRHFSGFQSSNWVRIDPRSIHLISFKPVNTWSNWLWAFGLVEGSL